MKKEKVLSFTLYVFCILALFYAAVMLFQTNTQIATYNTSSYVPMSLGEKIQFLFSNTYVPFFFAIITYALGNIVDMLHAMKNPEEVKTKSAEKAVEKEEAAVQAEESAEVDTDAKEKAEEPDPASLEQSDAQKADETEEPAETEQTEDTALENEPEKLDEKQADQMDEAQALAAEQTESADDSVTEEAEAATDQE